MTSKVVVILTLSFLPLSVLGQEGIRLFRVDVSMPQRNGRKEIDDIRFMKSTLRGLSGIKAHLAGKRLDSQGFYLVLEVENMCNWPSLTSPLIERGYKLSVTPLEQCTDYAKRLNVDVTFTPSSVFVNRTIMLTADVVFTDQDMDGAKYLDEVKKHLELNKLTMEMGIETQCYVSFIEFPIHLMYICQNSYKIIDESADKVEHDERSAKTITTGFLQNLNMYNEAC